MILKGIKNLEPIPKGTVPLVAKLIIKLIRIIKRGKRTWFMYTIETMMIFAWCFCLRCGEYTKTRFWDAPKVKSLSFTLGKQKTKCINYKLDRRKNRVHDEVEPIAMPCTCEDFGLCGYHSTLKYIKRCNKKGIRSPYLFPYFSKGSWKPVSAVVFRRELKHF